MAAALDSGKVTPNTTYDDKGYVKIDGYPIRNSDYKAHGIQTMAQVLEKSLNTGAIFTVRQIGNSFVKLVEETKPDDGDSGTQPEGIEIILKLSE